MKKQLKFYLLLPVIALPFITIAFACMGGGSGAVASEQKHSGLNTQLPDARNGKDSAKDKMTFYAQALNDSAKREEQLKNDPYSVKPVVAEEKYTPVVSIEEKVNSIRFRVQTPVYENKVSYEAPVQREVPKQIEGRADPDLEAINATIDKLSALQKPAAVVKEKTSKNIPVVDVQASNGDEDNYFGAKSGASVAKFLSDGVVQKNEGSMMATIPVEQTLQAGSIVSLQLNQTIKVGNQTLPAGAKVYGVASLDGERLRVEIPTVRVNDQIQNTSLSVYDIDGMEGIFVPGSISRDVVKSTADQSLQSVNVLSLDPSLKTQGIMAGIGAAKNLLSKKVKLVRVTVAAGYQVYLRNTHSL